MSAVADDHIRQLRRETANLVRPEQSHHQRAVRIGVRARIGQRLVETGLRLLVSDDRLRAAASR